MSCVRQRTSTKSPELLYKLSFDARIEVFPTVIHAAAASAGKPASSIANAHYGFLHDEAKARMNFRRYANELRFPSKNRYYEDPRKDDTRVSTEGGY